MEFLERVIKPNEEAIEFSCRQLVNILGEEYYKPCVIKGTELREGYKDDYVFAEKFSKIVPQYLGINDSGARILAKEILHDSYLERKRSNDTLRRYTGKGISLGASLVLAFLLPSTSWTIVAKELVNLLA